MTEDEDKALILCSRSPFWSAADPETAPLRVFEVTAALSATAVVLGTRKMIADGRRQARALAALGR